MEVKVNSKGAFGTQPSGLYREVVSVQRSKSIARELLDPTKWSLRQVHYIELQLTCI